MAEQIGTPKRLTAKKSVQKKAAPKKAIRKVQPMPRPTATLPDSVDAETIERLVTEAERGIPAQRLRRRGRPSIGAEASSTYSVRLPDDLVLLVDERSAIDGVSRGETIRLALIEYLTK